MAMYKSATLDYVTYSKHTDWNICHPIMILSSFVFAAYRRTPFGFLNPTVTKPLFQSLLIKLNLGQVNEQGYTCIPFTKITRSKILCILT